MQNISVILNARAGSLIGQDPAAIAQRVRTALLAPRRKSALASSTGARI